MKKVLKIFGGMLLVVLLAGLLFIGILTVTEYRPSAREVLTKAHETDPVLKEGDSLTIVSQNCGYGALGDNADFFMDGGTNVYTADKDRVLLNLSGIVETLNETDADIIFMQEVDINSSRSYGIDEREYLREAMDEADESFAYNYNVLYVPYPIPPIGHVESGLYTLSRYEFDYAERISLPCPFKWPVRLANLKRCLQVMRIPLENTEKELVLVNLHLEAFDNGEGKTAQTKELASFLQTEADKGNYVIAGGDFNQVFSNVKNPYPVYEGNWQPGLINTDAFSSGFSFLMDTSNPSCRSLIKPYEGEDESVFSFYPIDGFIVSDNIRVDSVETIQKDFVDSDHNPVKITVTIPEGSASR